MRVLDAAFPECADQSSIVVETGTGSAMKGSEPLHKIQECGAGAY
jgi:hypothetical protein